MLIKMFFQCFNISKDTALLLIPMGNNNNEGYFRIKLDNTTEKIELLTKEKSIFSFWSDIIALSIQQLVEENKTKDKHRLLLRRQTEGLMPRDSQVNSQVDLGKFEKSKTFNKKKGSLGVPKKKSQSIWLV